MKDAEVHLRQYVLTWFDIAIHDDRNAFDLNLGLLYTVE